MRRMEQMLHRCHPRDLIKKVVQEWGCPFAMLKLSKENYLRKLCKKVTVLFLAFAGPKEEKKKKSPLPQPSRARAITRNSPDDFALLFLFY